MLALGLAGVLAVTAACTGTSEATRPRAVASSAAPSPTADTARGDLLEALKRSTGVTHTYAVRADLPEGQKVKGDGALDLKGRRHQARMTVTGKDAGTPSRIVIGTDAYQRSSAKSEWVHLDLKRIAPDNSLLRFDWNDPTGLKAFTESIDRVQRTGAHTYTGKFDPDAALDEPFLPIGAPSLWALGLPMSPFTVTTDDQGWVTSIVVELSPRDKPKLRMTTTLSGHGKPLKISRPAHFGEADELYYN
ncbi:hypothetical protein Afe04nite_60310 [Asanoa ferruginea]|nr:hypothetical protein Afe04nite_60310 [Asanoa ferruginea]